MPTVDVPCTSVFTNSSFAALSGTLVDGVAAEGSGDYIFNVPGINSAINYLVDASAIPAGSAITQVLLLASAREAAGPGPNFLTDIAINSAAGNFSAGPFLLSAGFAEYTGLYPNPITLAQLSNSILGIGVANIDGAVSCEYLVFRVDYTPPPPPGMIATWVAPAWPPTCGVPPLRRFKPFDLIDRGATSPEEVTALYAAKFGQPPSGYYLWVVWRALNDDLWPNEQSPIEGYIVP